jgi:hypothetical protein
MAAAGHLGLLFALPLLQYNHRCLEIRKFLPGLLQCREAGTARPVFWMR